MRVLVVDDDPVARCVVESLLLQAGYEVRSASDGDEALRVQRDFGAPLVVSDWMMPGYDGLRLCERLRQIDGDSVYFILVSSNLQNGQRRSEVFAAGVDDCLEKPVIPEQLYDHVRRAETGRHSLRRTR